MRRSGGPSRPPGDGREPHLRNPGTATPATMMILGAGWFGFQVFWAFHSGPLPLFLRGFTDSKFTISMVLSLAGVAGCLVPPVVGYLSDRSSSRFGRRRPYVLLGFAGVLLCVIGFPHLRTFGVVAMLAGWMYLSLRLAETPFLSLLPDVTPPAQRSTASGVMNLCGSIGLIFCFLVSSRIWDEHPTAVFYTVALLSFGPVLLSLVVIREPERPAANPSSPSGPVRYLRSIAEEANAIRFFLAQFLWWLGFWMVSTFATLFVAEELGVREGQTFLVLMTFSIVATLFMLPLGMLGDRLGRKGILSAMVALWAGSEIVVGLSQNLGHALITVGLSAIPFAGIMGVGYAYMLDLVPQRRTAEFVGFSIISIALAQIVGPLIGGRLIDGLGYRSIFPAAAAFMMAGFVVLQFVRTPRAAASVG